MNYDRDDVIALVKDALARKYGRCDWDELDDYDKQAGTYNNGRWLSLENVVECIERAL